MEKRCAKILSKRILSALALILASVALSVCVLMGILLPYKIAYAAFHRAAFRLSRAVSPENPSVSFLRAVECHLLFVYEVLVVICKSVAFSRIYFFLDLYKFQHVFIVFHTQSIPLDFAKNKQLCHYIFAFATKKAVKSCT